MKKLKPILKVKWHNMKKIDLITLKSAVKGALRIYEQDGKVVLRRFTVCQEQFFNATVNYINKQLKCKASTSMVIDFCSQTENIALKADCFIASTRTPCFFDVYCDGKMVGHFGYNEFKDDKVSFSVNLPKGDKRITIYLPNLFEANITEFLIDDNAYIKPYKNAKKFMFLGDSITQGYVAEYPSKTYANQVARAFDAQALSWAIGGAYFLADDLAEKIDFVPDVISVAYGTNDWAHGYDILNNATEYFEKLIKTFPSSKIICITPIWRGDLEKRKMTATMPFDKVGDLLEDICKKLGINVIRGENLVDKMPENFIEDVLHPNDKGFSEYTKNLLESLKEKNI